MKLLLYSFLLITLIGGLSFGQVTLTLGSANAGPLQTGFAVVTPVAGIGEGLSVSETFGEQIGSNTGMPAYPFRHAWAHLPDLQAFVQAATEGPQA